MVKIEIQDKKNKVFLGIKNNLIGQEIYISKFDSADNYIEIDRFQTYIAEEGKVFDYIELDEAHPEHIYQQTIVIDRLYDSIDNYIQIDEPERENQNEAN